MNFKRLAVIAATVSLAVAGGSFAGVALAAPSPSGQQYTGCLLYGSLFNVAVGASPIHGCPRFATQIEWNQTGPQGPPGASNTKLYTWTVTVSGTETNNYVTQSATMPIAVGSIIVPVSATATGNMTSCTGGNLANIYVNSPNGQDMAAWYGPNNFDNTPTTQTNIELVHATGPLSAVVSCYGVTTAPTTTITIVFSVISPASGPAVTYN
jgi:hypothetical protein